MKKKRLEAWREVIAGTFRGFGQHRCMTESGALAFYTLFSLAPILIVAIAIGSAFFGEEAVVVSSCASSTISWAGSRRSSFGRSSNGSPGRTEKASGRSPAA